MAQETFVLCFNEPQSGVGSAGRLPTFRTTFRRSPQVIPAPHANHLTLPPMPTPPRKPDPQQHNPAQRNTRQPIRKHKHAPPHQRCTPVRKPKPAPAPIRHRTSRPHIIKLRMRPQPIMPEPRSRERVPRTQLLHHNSDAPHARFHAHTPPVIPRPPCVRNTITPHPQDGRRQQHQPGQPSGDMSRPTPNLHHPHILPASPFQIPTIELPPASLLRYIPPLRHL